VRRLCQPFRLERIATGLPGALPQAIAFLPFRQTPVGQDKLFIAINGFEAYGGKPLRRLQKVDGVVPRIPQMNLGVNDWDEHHRDKVEIHAFSSHGANHLALIELRVDTQSQE